MQSTPPSIETLHHHGQSIWYDNLSRDVLQSGELASLIEQGITGLTSNPAIFRSAIVGSSLYNEDIASFAAKGWSAAEITKELTCLDVQSAADLLLPVYERTDGEDGFASIEVHPALAHDENGTVEEAQYLYERIDRPNIMIKVPGTEAGARAIKRLIAAGISVNVTLLFSTSHYQAVLDAYKNGIKERLDGGVSIDSVKSVASFFISRIDARVEKVLSAASETVKKNLFMIGIRNALDAYKIYLKDQEQDFWDQIRKGGGDPQRLLWASTAPKNENYDPLVYVESLALKDTVNTLPPATLKELMERSDFEVVSSYRALDGDSTTSQALATLEPSFTQILDELQDEGIKAFQQAFEELTTAVSEQARKG